MVGLQLRKLAAFGLILLFAFALFPPRLSCILCPHQPLEFEEAVVVVLQIPLVFVPWHRNLGHLLIVWRNHLVFVLWHHRSLGHLLAFCFLV